MHEATRPLVMPFSYGASCRRALGPLCDAASVSRKGGVPEMVELGPSADDVLREAMTAAIASFHRADAKLLGSVDPEDVHDARVAMRRLRSMLRTYAELFERGYASTIRADLRWYGTLLGGVRDLDVTALRLQPYLDKTSDLAGKAELEAFLASENARAQTALLEGRADPRYRLVLRQMEDLGAHAPMAARAARQANNELLEMIRRPWRDVREAGRVAKKSAKANDLHLLRIRSKELRYAAEVIARVEPSRGAALTRAARDLQDRIGEHRDAVRTVAFIEEFERLVGKAMFVSDEAMTSERRKARDAIKDYQADLRNVRRAWRALRATSRKVATSGVAETT